MHFLNIIYIIVPFLNIKARTSLYFPNIKTTNTRYLIKKYYKATQAKAVLGPNIGLKSYTEV